MLHIQKNNSTIFRTLNGDLTVFNKTLISTKDNLKALETVNATVYNKNGAFNLQGLLVNPSKSVSTFTKLNNAVKIYNSNLTKSAQLQNAYVQAVGNQNTSLGNYLAGLNGAKASMGGYIKSLVAAKVASIGLQVASVALNTVISMGITLIISKWIHAQEEARQKSVELTNAYKEQKELLDSQIEKYKKLKESLDKGNLSTDEARSIKEQLLEIQKSLVESYGNEASNIDLVNGKYREQLGLLIELSKEKATDYVTENRDKFADAKAALKKIRTYNLGTVTGWDTYSPETDKQRKLIEYLKNYSSLLEITQQNIYDKDFVSTTINLSVKANIENADELMHQLAEDLEQYGKDNDIDVSRILEEIPKQLRKTKTDELKEYKVIYDEFMKAEVIRNDTLRPLYQQSIQAVEDYNKALSSDEGVENAKANLDSVQQSVQNATSELEGSQEVFNGIYDGINKNAESAYNLEQAFENDESVQGYAEQLKGLTDTDLKAINFKDNVQSPGEEAFAALIDILGLSGNEVQKLIDKLVELGYVQGNVQDLPLDNKTEHLSLSISQTADQLNTRLKPAMDSLKSTWNDIFTGDEVDLNSIDILSTCDSIKSKLDELNKIEGITVDYSSYEDFVRVLSDSESTTSNVKDAFNSLATSIAQAALSGTEDFKTLKAALEDLGVVNSEIVAFDALISNTEALKEAGIDLASVTNERLLEFANESVAAENAAQAYEMLRFHKELCNLQEMNTSSEVANLRTLAKNAGYTGSIIQYLTELEQIYQELASGTTNPIVIGVKLARAAQLQTLIQNAAGNINYEPEVDFHGVKESASSAAQSFTDLLDKELTVLDKKMEAGYIDFNEYIQARLVLIEDYYQQGKIKTDEYYSYLENHYKQELSYRDKVIKAVTRRIDKEIKSLEKEKDAIKENYQLQIDALENQKTLLEDVNKERQRQIDLQKALYELERAKNQRTKLVYSEGGMHYVADDTAIRDAENETENARYEIQISEIEKSISQLEQARDAETDAIDDMIDKLQEYKEKWNDITSAYEEEQEDLIAAQMLGQEWENDILDARLDKLNQFKDDYIKIQQAMVDAAHKTAQAIANL